MGKLKKIFGVAVNILFAAMLIAGVAMIILRAFGFKMLAVETGSMGENFPVGSLLIVESCSADSVKAGDVISFVANEDLVTVTHRVVEIDSENKLFITKGDANNTEDENPVPFENLIGRVRFKLPKLGYAVIWGHTKGGKLCMTLAFALLITAVSFGSCLKKIGEGRKKEHDDK